MGPRAPAINVFAIRLFAISLSLSALPGAPAARAECGCLWQGSFAEVQAATDLVVGGRVVAAKGNAIDLALSHTLRGAPAPGIIRIWLQTGDYCRPPVDDFPLESTWVMALRRVDQQPPGGFDPNTPNVSYGRVGDYVLSSCGGYWLELGDGVVTGNLVKAPRWDRNPKMTPVLLDLITAFVEGRVGSDTLLEASREDPALRELMLDTREFLRYEE